MYADHASTSHPTLFPAEPPDPSWGNPSNTHAMGLAASRALQAERSRVERLLNAPPLAVAGDRPRVVFTSGGTEANNLVLQGYPWDFVVTTATEHTAVYFTAQYLSAHRAVDVAYLPVDGTGAVDLADLARVIEQHPPSHRGLVSLMYVNNEIGTVHNLRAVAAVCRRYAQGGGPPRVSLHTDAVQAVGHVPVDVQELGVDFLSLGAHKFHGPAGVGVLYCRDPSWLRPLWFGGHQQGGLRPGTEAVPLIRALGKALEDAVSGLPARTAVYQRMTQRVWQTLRPFVVTGLVLPTGPPPGPTRAPHHVSFCVRGVHRRDLLARFEAAGLFVSGGSACSSDSALPSHVLSTIGVPLEYIHGSLRITFSHTNTEDEVERLLCPFLWTLLSGLVVR